MKTRETRSRGAAVCLAAALLFGHCGCQGTLLSKALQLENPSDVRTVSQRSLRSRDRRGNVQLRGYAPLDDQQNPPVVLARNDMPNSASVVHPTKTIRSQSLANPFPLFRRKKKVPSDPFLAEKNGQPKQQARIESPPRTTSAVRPVSSSKSLSNQPMTAWNLNTDETRPPELGPEDVPNLDRKSNRFVNGFDWHLDRLRTSPVTGQQETRKKQFSKESPVVVENRPDSKHPAKNGKSVTQDTPSVANPFPDAGSQDTVGRSTVQSSTTRTLRRQTGSRNPFLQSKSATQARSAADGNGADGPNILPQATAGQAANRRPATLRGNVSIIPAQVSEAIRKSTSRDASEQPAKHNLANVNEDFEIKIIPRIRTVGPADGQHRRADTLVIPTSASQVSKSGVVPVFSVPSLTTASAVEKPVIAVSVPPKPSPLNPLANSIPLKPDVALAEKKAKTLPEKKAKETRIPPMNQPLALSVPEMNATMPETKTPPLTVDLSLPIGRGESTTREEPRVPPAERQPADDSTSILLQSVICVLLALVAGLLLFRRRDGAPATSGE